VTTRLSASFDGMSASTAMAFGIFTRATTIHGAAACENLVEKQGAHPRRLKGVL
jgi:hypothetical protein